MVRPLDCSFLLVLLVLWDSEHVRACMPAVSASSDKFVCVCAARWLQPVLAKLISTLRAPKSSEGYKKIGGGSPLRRITQEQANALEDALRARGQDARVYVGMRYWYPFMEDAVAQVRFVSVALLQTRHAKDFGRLDAAACVTLGMLQRCLLGSSSADDQVLPVMHWLSSQGHAVQTTLGMVLSVVLMEAGRAQIKADGVTDLVVLPLYPQFSISTSGSSLRLLQQMFEADAELDGLRHCVIASW